MRTSVTSLGAAVLIGLVTVCAAKELPATAPADAAAGTWAFTLRVEDLTIDSVAELKQAGGTITGTVITGVAAKGSEIKDGKLSGHEIRFTVDRVEEQGTFESRYSGKLEGDEIRGKVEFGWIDVPGHAGMSTVDWIATRTRDGSKPNHGVR